MQRIYRTIIEHISKIYDKNESKAIAMNQQQRKKTGESSLGPSKQQTRFFQICNNLADQLRQLGERMAKSQQLTDKGQMRNYSNIVLETARNVEGFKKRKVLNVKANKSVMRLCEQTNQLTPKLGASLTALQKGSGFCCGGGDLKQNFRNMMIAFRQNSANWRFFTEVQPKQMSQTFITQQFNENEFMVIRQILSKNWPEGNKVIEKQKIVQVQVRVPVEVIKYVDNSKPSRLSLANQLIYGINRQMNPCCGIQIYIQQADRNNNLDACNMLGQVYELGQLLPKDFEKAMYYYKKSHDAKNPYGMYLYARGLQRGLLRQQRKPTKEDLTLALKLYNVSAESNCSDACVQLADIYERGHFDSPNQEATVGKDLKKALYFYRKARDLGSPKSLNNMAVMYLKNKNMDQNNPNNILNTDANIQKNQRTAINLLEEAVSTGFPMAFFNLGSLYQKGEGVDKNIDQAKELFYDGASKGCNKCKISYAFQLIDQTAIFKQSFQQEYIGALKWLEEVVAQSDREEDLCKAFYYIGLFYEFGFGVDQKATKAVQMFEKSAYLVYPPAMNKLGHCYYSGFGVKLDKRIAIGYYKQAAQQGNDEALVNLGTAYYCGIQGILERNYDYAYEYFEKAMKAGNTDAYVHLSQMYEKGVVVAKDQKLAHELLVMGALKKNQNAIYMLNQRGKPVQDLVQNFQFQFSSLPRPIEQTEVPYIKNLNKALSSSVSRLRA